MNAVIGCIRLGLKHHYRTDAVTLCGGSDRVSLARNCKDWASSVQQSIVCL